MILVVLLMLIVVIPVFVLTGFIVWKYRVGNSKKVKYNPTWDSNKALEATWWLIPATLIAVLGFITWCSSHQLDPYKPLASKTPALNVQVVALDWKWLFIYPAQHIASVNLVQFPVNRPVHFYITADAPMNSFWIPQLSGQMYAMPGMQTQLNLSASSLGSFHGGSANISGQGFARMEFWAKASSTRDFNAWVAAAQHSSASLTAASYQKLAEPSQSNAVAYYKAPQTDLFNSVIASYMMPGMELPK